MKLSFLAFVSALILSQGANVHAQGAFSKAFGEKLDQVQYADAEPIDTQHVSRSVDATIQTVGYCEPSCGAPDACDSGCDSWFGATLAPGTGAFGGDSRFSGFIGFNQDTFFGNYTTASAGFAVNERVDVTFYTIMWHTDFFSQNGLGAPGGVQGTGLWTEFGGGLNFKYMGGALNVNPQIGILNGALLSSGGGANEPVVFDGVVPNLTANYADDFLESQLYMGYYAGSRGVDQNDYLHWWYNVGVKPWGDNNNWLSALSTGVHYEMLRQTGPNAADNLYSWIGPYIQFALPNGFSVRYSAGWNVDDGMVAGTRPQGLGDNFYKVNLGYSF